MTLSELLRHVARDLLDMADIAERARQLSPEERRALITCVVRGLNDVSVRLQAGEERVSKVAC